MREINTSNNAKFGIGPRWLFGLLILALAAVFYANESSSSLTEREAAQLVMASNAKKAAELRQARRIQLLGIHETVSDEFTRPRTFHHKVLREMSPEHLSKTYDVSYFFSLTKITDRGTIVYPQAIKHRYNIKILITDELYDMTPSSQLDDQRLAEVFLNAPVGRIRIRTDMTGTTTDFVVEGELLKAFKETLELAQTLRESPMNGEFDSIQIARMYADKINFKKREIRRPASDQIQAGVSSNERLRQLMDLHERISDDFTRPREFKHKKLIQLDSQSNGSTPPASEFFLKTTINDQGTVQLPWRSGYFIRVLIGDDLFASNPMDRSKNQALASIFLNSSENRVKIKTNLSGDIVEFTAEGELLKAFRETVELAELLKESPMK